MSDLVGTHEDQFSRVEAQLFLDKQCDNVAPFFYQEMPVQG